MHPVITKTFGGLTPRYYIRHFLFALALMVFIVFMTTRGPTPVNYSAIAFLAVCTLLYPYSRFVYESVVGFLMGSNVFFVNAILMLVVKGITMVLCWVFAIFIAPIGLAYLYFHHSRGRVDA